MNHDNIDNVLKQFLDEKSGSFTHKPIPLTDGMIERLDTFADELDITTEQAASFLLWSYLVDIEQKTNRIKQRMMN